MKSCRASSEAVVHRAAADAVLTVLLPVRGASAFCARFVLILFALNGQNERRRCGLKRALAGLPVYHSRPSAWAHWLPAQRTDSNPLSLRICRRSLRSCFSSSNTRTTRIPPSEIQPRSPATASGSSWRAVLCFRRRVRRGDSLSSRYSRYRVQQSWARSISKISSS